MTSTTRGISTLWPPRWEIAVATFTAAGCAETARLRLLATDWSRWSSGFQWKRTSSSNVPKPRPAATTAKKPRTLRSAKCGAAAQPVRSTTMTAPLPGRLPGVLLGRSAYADALGLQLGGERDPDEQG